NHRAPAFTGCSAFAEHDKSERHSQHRLDGDAGGRLLRRPIDVGDIVEFDHALDRKFPGHDQIDELWDEFLRHAVALNAAADHAALLQERHFERNFAALAGAAEQHASAGRHEGFDGLAKYR